MNGHMNRHLHRSRKVMAITMILLFMVLPFVSALEIRNVRAENITATGTIISWETDEPADSFVYSKPAENTQPFIPRGDASAVLEHHVPLQSLMPETEYQYRVESGGIVDDNGANLYAFTTSAPDTSVPEIEVEVPSLVNGNTVTASGETEARANVVLHVNGELAASGIAGAEGDFTFSDIRLAENQENTLLFEARDLGGNSGSRSVTVVSDTIRPRITITPLHALVETKTVTLHATISEEAHYGVTVGNESVHEGDGTIIEEDLGLEEGKNVIRVSVRDLAGWETREELIIVSDTEVPQITAEIERGMDYYEGRAESDIHGTTEANATMFLYIYKPLGYEYKPDFQKARAIVHANEQGEFTFDDVKFSASVLDATLGDLKPREVPSGLQEFSIFPTAQQEQQQFSYYVFIIAEDRTGKTSSWQRTVTVNTCFSPNLDFSAESIPQFQAPYRLVPQLLDDGRQEIQAVFEFKYLGNAIPLLVNGQETEPGARITSIRFDKACTQAMSEDDRFGLGCKLLPSRERTQVKNPTGSATYVTWNLQSSQELSKRQDDFWDEFKKRQIVLPLKITLTYQERQGGQSGQQAGTGNFASGVGTSVAGQNGGGWSETKVQTVCYDLSYFVDIPIESKQMIPDFLADEGVQSLDFTIEQIQRVRPILEKAFLFTAIGCMGSFLLRTTARWIRLTTSRVEHYMTIIKLKKDKNDPSGCPVGQFELYTAEEVEHWLSLPDEFIPEKVRQARHDEALRKQITLEERCPRTASAWKFESAMQTAFQWTCDRAFCRAVPARWTEEKEENAIGEVILKQQQCAVTGRGIPLLKRENCQDLIRTNPIRMPDAIKIEDVNVCWQTADGTLYYYKEDILTQQEREDTKQGVYRLTPVGKLLGDIGTPAADKLIVYKPEGSDGYVVGKEQTCAQVCGNPRKPGYGPDKQFGTANGCYEEQIAEDGTVQLFGSDKKVLGEEDKKRGVIGKRYEAGYTKDCFIKGYETGAIQLGENGQPQFQQCVCVGEQSSLGKYHSSDLSLRTAIPKQTKEGNEIREKWFYHQERTFKESGKTKGTYYPDIRYYEERDFSGAFGQNSLLDVVTGRQNIPDVNPYTQFTGMFQTVCLSSILKNLRMLESILTGLRNCLVEAKYTGLQDAGMCKTLFTQHVCGLLYKAVAYFANSCSPSTFDDVGKEGKFGDVGVIVQEGIGNIPKALDSSVTDFREEYGNAQLNEFFKAGAQGFAQSMCLAAFGYEFPLFSDEFLLDAAYATPMKTSVLLAPKERELSTYNPARQTAIYNYNIGGVILPGCRIRNWKVSLKCIGPEDQGYRGIDLSCNGKGCDCLNAQGTSALESEKEHLLMTGFDLASGQMFSVPLESPQRVDSHYRYDHVKVELTLDPTERGNEDKCFDEGYFVNGKGVFYEPLIDVSQPVDLGCNADLVTGQYRCEALGSLFGFGGASMEEPYVTCWNKKTGTWTECSTPNLFVRNDEIKIRPHLNLDAKGKCLKRTVRPLVAGIPEETIRTLPENVPGPFYPEETLGVVVDTMFGSGTNTFQLLPAPASSGSCSGVAILEQPSSVVSSIQQYPFAFEPTTDPAKVRLVLPGAGVTIETAGYSRSGNYLAQGTGAGALTELTISDINDVVFNVGGFKVKGVLLGVSAGDAQKVCAYQVIPGGQITQSLNAREIQVTYELLERDEGGSCAFARIPVRTSIGRGSYTARVRIQKEETAFSQSTGMHVLFSAGNYDQVHAQAIEIFAQKRGDLNNALAAYYEVASLIMKGAGVTRYRIEITNVLRLFFERNYAGQPIDPYEAGVTSTTEFKKIKMYMCQIAKSPQLGYVPPAGKCP